MTIKELALQVQPQVTALRHELHAHPELGMQEFETTKKVAAVMEELGIPYRLTDPTGLIAEIRGTAGESSHCVLLRADMDCLKIKEETGLPYSSETDGLMHACGHDTHTAMLTGAARVLMQLRDQFAGTVRLVFQPAEETAEGGIAMVKQGAADGVDLGLGLHIASDWATGILKSRRGPWGASVDRFTIKVTGKGCHGAGPSEGVDPVYAAAAIIQQLQTMVSREFHPMEPVVVSVCSMHAGTLFNIIPDTAELLGTCRCFSREVWEKLPQVMERIASHTAQALRCTAEVKFERIVKPMINDDLPFDILKGAVKKVIDDPSQWVEAPMTMGGEDFSAFSAKIPIAMVQLGADGGAHMHNCHVNFKEEAFPTGVACYVQFALDALERLNAGTV